MNTFRVAYVTIVVWSALAMLNAQAHPVALSHLISAPTSAPVQLAPKQKTALLSNYGKLPLAFEANQGQTDPRVKFLSRGSGFTLFLTGNEAVFSMRETSAMSRKGKLADGKVPFSPKLKRTGLSAKSAVLRMRLVHSNPTAKITGEGEQPGKTNYFIGNDPKKWRSGVATYGKVRYTGVYPGIDLVYYGNQRQLEYDFIVSPGSDPSRIQFDVRGSSQVHVDAAGDLLIETGATEMRWRRPKAYQEKDGARQDVRVRYSIHGANNVGFEFATYDKTRSLIVDPVLAYSTFLGGSGADYGGPLAVDSAGNVYVAGLTNSADFPTMPGAYQTACSANCSTLSDLFIAKLNPEGSALIYSTYLGGSGEDYALSIAIDSAGASYLTGLTQSADFPITSGAFQTVCNGGANCATYGDGFVAKLEPSGMSLAYSTYLGGSGSDSGGSIAVDGHGDAYIAGGTESADFPATAGAFQMVCNGGSNCATVGDGFVAKLNPSGSALVYATYLGGSARDSTAGIAIDSLGHAFVTGSTSSADFSITAGAFQATCGGGCESYGDAFVVEMNTSGSALVFSTYLGGSDNNDYGTGVVVDSSGDVYVVGVTESADFPTTLGAFQTSCATGACGGGDAFVTKMNSTGSALVYSTYLGGSGEDEGYAIAVDSSGSAYVSGRTHSGDFPKTLNAFQATYGGNGDAFVAVLDAAGSALSYSTFLGGANLDQSNGVGLDALGNFYVAGATESAGFPVTTGAFQTGCGGGCIHSTPDAFIARFATGILVAPGTLNFGNQTVGVKSIAKVVTVTNASSGLVTLNSFTITGANASDFAKTNTCGASLAVGASCTVSVTFKPGASGARNATLNITDNAQNSPQAVPLSGMGVTPSVLLTPSSLTFATQVVFTSSAGQVVTLTNTGLGSLTINNVAITSSFTQSKSCGASLAAGASCTITVKFNPQVKNTITGTLTVTDSAAGSPHTVALSGVGTYVQLTPTTLNFGNQPVGTTSLAKKVTLSNKGGGPVAITSITKSGTNAPDFTETNTCPISPATLASGASCFITTTFTPSAKGKRTGTISVNDDGGGSPQTISLTGSGT